MTKVVADVPGRWGIAARVVARVRSAEAGGAAQRGPGIGADAWPYVYDARSCKPLRVALLELRGHAVVIAIAERRRSRNPADVLGVGPQRGAGDRRIGGAEVGAGIPVRLEQLLGLMIADIGDLQCGLPGQFPLDGNVPLVDQAVAEVRGKHRGRRWGPAG